MEGGLVVRSLEGGLWCPSSKDGVGQGTGCDIVNEFRYMPHWGST